MVVGSADKLPEIASLECVGVLGISHRNVAEFELGWLKY